MKTPILLSILLTFTIIWNVVGQESTTALKHLEIRGIIKSSDKSNLELANCIAHSAMIQGVSSYSESESASLDSSFVEGSYYYSFYVNNYESEAGIVNFNYSYQIKDGRITYTFYDFQHDGNETEFKSIGALPEKWNDEVGKVFTKKQYAEIMKDLLANTNNTIRMIKKYCMH